MNTSFKSHVLNKNKLHVPNGLGAKGLYPNPIGLPITTGGGATITEEGGRELITVVLLIVVDERGGALMLEAEERPPARPPLRPAMRLEVGPKSKSSVDDDTASAASGVNKVDSINDAATMEEPIVLTTSLLLLDM